MAREISRRRLFALATGAAVIFSAGPVFAARLQTPQGKPVLRIGGKISTHNQGDEAVFDLSMLEALGTSNFSTSTPWTDGVSDWEGVRLDVLMKAVGASGDTLRATALNDYVADVPLADIGEEGPILAMKRNGELMPISDKGPLFIVYPFDGNPNLQQQNVYMRCAWHIARLDVL
ncbi:molybdopterin-dependent oxidoreductase [Aurantimonas sp. A2-1-M11]|uniref:molybdopterin-dependent oxidoreductase n=1 Tax=Aurantimonas sp. A2-1-M11 TaxID=3113712 RepID=UPI002F954AEF